LQAAIKDKYGLTADLKEGAGGIFTVAINDHVVYNNQVTYRFPEHEEIFTEIEKVKS
jgi:predicted Rdx family selenoprotein